MTPALTSTMSSPKSMQRCSYLFFQRKQLDDGDDSLAVNVLFEREEAPNLRSYSDRICVAIRTISFSTVHTCHVPGHPRRATKFRHAILHGDISAATLTPLLLRSDRAASSPEEKPRSSKYIFRFFF